MGSINRFFIYDTQHIKMEVQYLDQTVHPHRVLKKIPGKQEDRSVINHDELGRMICFERRDIVSDVLKVFLKFMKEVNMMANFGGEEIDWDPSKDENCVNKIAPMEKDVHPRQIGIAFFSLAANVIANWEDAYLKACKEFIQKMKEQGEEKEQMKEQGEEKEQMMTPSEPSTSDTQPSHSDPEEPPKISDQNELPDPSQTESKCFQDAWDAMQA